MIWLVVFDICTFVKLHIRGRCKHENKAKLSLRETTHGLHHHKIRGRHSTDMPIYLDDVRLPILFLAAAPGAIQAGDNEFPLKALRQHIDGSRHVW